MYKKSLFEKLEDWFLEHPTVKDKWLEDAYFWWCRIWDKFTNLYYYGPRNFLNGIWVFRSYLWDHHWFDHYYLLNLLRIKLRYDAKHYRKYGVAVDASKYALQMEECCDIIDKLIEDNYDIKLSDEVDLKWGVPDPFKTLEKGMISNWLEPSEREKSFTEDERKSYNDEKREIYKEADKLRQADTKKLFEIMKDKIWYWWD